MLCMMKYYPDIYDLTDDVEYNDICRNSKCEPESRVEETVQVMKGGVDLNLHKLFEYRNRMHVLNEKV